MEASTTKDPDLANEILLQIIESVHSSYDYGTLTLLARVNHFCKESVEPLLYTDMVIEADMKVNCLRDVPARLKEKVKSITLRPTKSCPPGNPMKYSPQRIQGHERSDHHIWRFLASCPNVVTFDADRVWIDLSTEIGIPKPSNLKNLKLSLDLNYGWDAYNMGIAKIPLLPLLDHLSLRFRDQQSAVYFSGLVHRESPSLLTTPKISLNIYHWFFSIQAAFMQALRAADDGPNGEGVEPGLKELEIIWEDCDSAFFVPHRIGQTQDDIDLIALGQSRMPLGICATLGTMVMQLSEIGSLVKLTTSVCLGVDEGRLQAATTFYQDTPYMFYMVGRHIRHWVHNIVTPTGTSFLGVPERELISQWSCKFLGAKTSTGRVVIPADAQFDSEYRRKLAYFPQDREMQFGGEEKDGWWIVADIEEQDIANLYPCRTWKYPPGEDLSSLWHF